MSETTLMTQELPEEQAKNAGRQSVLNICAAATAVFCVAITLTLLAVVLMSAGSKTTSTQANVQNATIMDKFDMYMTNEISNALDGVLSVEKVYWLSDSDIVAPEPNPSGYGQVDSPSELMWLLDEAKDLIGDQEMLFNENTPVWEGDKIYYYYDETILVITWKEIRDRSIFTISEVKVSHPSQFRRFLADGEYGSDKQYTTTEMAANANAVVASSGDFYKFRQYGTIVYGGQVQRFEGHYVDTCFINDDGDLVFAYRDQLQTEEDAEKFAEENNVRFSLAFGPILVDNGEVVQITNYPLGEIDREYSRAALCQMDDLHYLLVNCCGESNYQGRMRITTFAKYIGELGCEKAYALDGGQTTVIAMNDEMISSVDFGTQRRISDIIYFATAVPEGG
ncbi:MAG: phosphodiester glycosidase family protein [Oscillospiraceae bacterium]|nr:phosphodiester glycosidase family protein [Oscillospiraceae bacterium]